MIHNDMALAARGLKVNAINVASYLFSILKQTRWGCWTF